MVLNIILCIVFCFLSEILTYKLIKRIDKKERKKLQIWEQEFVETMQPEIERLNIKYMEFIKLKEKSSEVKWWK